MNVLGPSSSPHTGRLILPKASLLDDEVLPEERSEIRAFLDLPEQEYSTPDVAKFQAANSFEPLMEILPDIDANSDSRISKRELLNALRDPHSENDRARLLAGLYNSFKYFQNDQGVASVNLSTDDKLLEKFNNGLYEADIKNVSNEPGLFGNSGSPDPFSIRQGKHDDCWFLATMSLLPKDEIQSFIKPTNDGYLVEFPGHEPELVLPPTHAERMVYAKSDGDWAVLLEKAMDQILERQGADLNHRAVAEAMRTVTGEGSVNMGLKGEAVPALRSTELIGDVLDQCLQDGRLIVACTVDEPDEKLHNRLFPQHAYAVVGFNPETKMVKVRNPWGEREKADNDGVNDGLFEMPLLEFHTSFVQMTISDRSHD